MKVRGWIFDYGGTLDTGGCHWGRMFWHAFERAGMAMAWTRFREAYIQAERTIGRQRLVTPHDTFEQVLLLKLDLQTRYLCQRGELKGDEQLRQRWCRQVHGDLYARVKSHTACSREVLRMLRRPCVLVSNFYGNMPVVLREFQLDDLFDAVIESAAVGIRKPDPRIFQMGVEALDMRPAEVAVVGDSIVKDIAPAKSIGCQTVWIEGEGWDDVPPDTTVPRHIVRQLSELLQLNIDT